MSIEDYAPPRTVEELLQELAEVKQVNEILSAAGKELETIVAETKSQWINSEKRADEAEARCFALQKNFEDATVRADTSDENLRLADSQRVEANLRAVRAEKRAASAEQGRLEAEARVELIEAEIAAVTANQAEQHAEWAIERAEAQRTLVETTTAHERELQALESRMKKEREEMNLEKEAITKSLTDRILHLSLQLCSLEEAHSVADAENINPSSPDQRARPRGQTPSSRRKSFHTPPRPPTGCSSPTPAGPNGALLERN